MVLKQQGVNFCLLACNVVLVLAYYINFQWLGLKLVSKPPVRSESKKRVVFSLENQIFLVSTPSKCLVHLSWLGLSPIHGMLVDLLACIQSWYFLLGHWTAAGARVNSRLLSWGHRDRLRG